MPRVAYPNACLDTVLMSHHVDDWEYEYAKAAVAPPNPSTTDKNPADQSLTPYYLTHPAFLSKGCRCNLYPKRSVTGTYGHCPYHCLQVGVLMDDRCNCIHNDGYCGGDLVLLSSVPPQHTGYTSALEASAPSPGHATQPDSKTTHESLNIDLSGWTDVESMRVNVKIVTKTDTTNLEYYSHAN